MVTSLLEYLVTTKFKENTLVTVLTVLLEFYKVQKFQGFHRFLTHLCSKFGFSISDRVCTSKNLFVKSWKEVIIENFVPQKFQLNDEHSVAIMLQSCTIMKILITML